MRKRRLTSIEQNNITMRRPNKLAKGMTKTRYQQTPQTPPTDAILKLLVRGTVDALSGYWSITERKPCPCCECKCRGKLQLNDAGRSRLRRIKQSHNLT